MWRGSELEYIKNLIMKSRISELFNLDIIDWYDCLEKSLVSLVKAACDLYTKENLTVTKISEKLKIGKTAVRRYLRKGEYLNLCTYNSKKKQVNNQKRASKGRKSAVI